MNPTSEPSRFKRFVRGGQLSPLETIVGRDRYGAELVANSTWWISMVAGGGAVGLALAGTTLELHRATLAGLVAACFAMIGVIHAVGPRGESLFFPLIALAAGPLSAGVVWLAGPQFAVTSALPPAYVAACSLFFSRRITLTAAGMSVTCYGLTVLLQNGYPRPWARIVLLAAATTATGLVIDRFVRNLERLARSERELLVEVAAARAALETQVTDQVDEIDRLGQLRRFLTPQIAESVLSGDADTLLSTHRRRIAVFFCDLRGFTRFSSTAEPEDIGEVLTEYYETLGRAIDAHGATVGGFSGDGVFAFFNDPFPIEDPAGKAFAMAMSLREPLARIGQLWERRGFSLSYGLSIAYGYATMGTIGFDSRTECTAVGSVVNLGARLCDQAGPRQLLIDARAYSELSEEVGGESTQLMLKGFNDPVAAYRIAL